MGMICVCLSACNNPATVENNNVAATDTIPKTPEQKNESLVLEGEYVVEKEMITAVIVKKQGSSEVFQKIEGLQLDYMQDHPAYEKPSFEDLNFDGFPDMFVTSSMGNVNVYSDYWLYNPATKQLEQNKDMELCLFEIDKDNQEILSFERSSAAESKQTYYKYKEGKFVKTKIEERTYKNETTYRLVTQELQADGKMKKVKDEVIVEKK